MIVWHKENIEDVLSTGPAYCLICVFPHMKNACLQPSDLRNVSWFQVQDNFNRQDFNRMCWTLCARKNLNRTHLLISDEDAFKIWCIFNLLSEDKYPLAIVTEEVRLDIFVACPNEHDQGSDAGTFSPNTNLTLCNIWVDHYQLNQSSVVKLISQTHDIALFSCSVVHISETSTSVTVDYRRREWVMGKEVLFWSTVAFYIQFWRDILATPNPLSQKRKLATSCFFFIFFI